MTQSDTNTNPGNQPKLIAYAVRDGNGPDGKGFWTRIGAAWDHKDGEGYTPQLELVPTGEGRIVLRPPRDENEEAETEQSEDAAVEETEDEGAGE